MKIKLRKERKKERKKQTFCRISRQSFLKSSNFPNAVDYRFKCPSTPVFSGSGSFNSVELKDPLLPNRTIEHFTKCSSILKN